MAQSTTKPYWHISIQGIPARLAAGMFFFCTSALADSLQLATELFNQNEWTLCHRECKRALLNDRAPRERFQLLSALCSTHTERLPEKTIVALQQILSEQRDAQVCAMASYELGRQQWTAHQPEQALDSFAYSFNTTTNKSLFLHAACSAFLLMNDQPALKKERAAFIDQINTSRSQWHGSLFGECARPQAQTEQLNAVVRFYRAQISPAIGERCTLEPSCSEYFNQAHAKHGITAIPMIADRFFREPGVNKEQRDPVIVDGKRRFRDPLHDHDFWMKK